MATLRDPGVRGSSHRTELLAWLTTFVTMAYIVWARCGMFAHVP
jgi:xanthine/uracil/vitamin C permease (AzgA family)